MNEDKTEVGLQLISKEAIISTDYDSWKTTEECAIFQTLG
jgi:hypothetical protein